MKRVLRKTPVVLVSGLTAVTIACPAVLAGVNVDVDGDKTKIWVDGLNPGESYDYAIDGLDKTKSRTVNSCGWISLSFSYGETAPASVKISDDKDLVVSQTAVDTSALPEQAWFCKNGVVVDALGEVATASGNFMDPSGKYIFTGYTQNSRQYVMYVGVPDTRKKKANQCGLISFTHDPTTPTKDFSSFSFDGSAYTLAGLTQMREVRCKKYKDDTYMKLVPTPI